MRVEIPPPSLATALATWAWSEAGKTRKIDRLRVQGEPTRHVIRRGVKRSVPRHALLHCLCLLGRQVGYGLHPWPLHAALFASSRRAEQHDVQARQHFHVACPRSQLDLRVSKCLRSTARCLAEGQNKLLAGPGASNHPSFYPLQKTQRRSECVFVPPNHAVQHLLSVLCYVLRLVRGFAPQRGSCSTTPATKRGKRTITTSQRAACWLKRSNAAPQKSQKSGMKKWDSAAQPPPHAQWS